MSNIQTLDEFPVMFVGCLRQITAVRSSKGETLTTAPWKSVGKVQAGNQFCLVVKDINDHPIYLSICRVHEIPEVKKLKAELEACQAALAKAKKQSHDMYVALTGDAIKVRLDSGNDWTKNRIQSILDGLVIKGASHA